MATAAEKANLARIRDNQRRSRARRKEYLQELEARVRSCELQGIEASSEIQMVARRVAEENKLLRSLLAQHGVGDESVEAYLRQPQTNVSPTDQFSNSPAVQALEQLLEKPQPCRCPPDLETEESKFEMASRASSASAGTAPSSMYGQHIQPVSSRAGGQMKPTPQLLTPTSISGGNASSMGHSPSANLPNPWLLPVSGPSPSSSRVDTQLFDLHDHNYPTQNTYSSGHLQHYNQSHDHSYAPVSMSGSANVNNCSYATSLITTMAGGDPSAVRADLGCMSDMDCEVDNQMVFNVMDRYSGSGL